MSCSETGFIYQAASSCHVDRGRMDLWTYPMILLLLFRFHVYRNAIENWKFSIWKFFS